MTDEQIKRKIAAEKRRKRQKRRVIVMCIAIVLAVADGFLAGRLAGSRSVSVAEVPELTETEPAAELVTTAEDIPIVNTAVAEIGNKGGDKFWSWYGFGSHVAWCACYVSWVENECGMLSDGTAPKFSLVSDGSSWFKSRGQWLGADETPAAGDLIFFDWEQDGGQDHVGIVTAVAGDTVFTVEGNSSDRCRMKRYYIGDPVIYGYGHIVS